MSTPGIRISDAEWQVMNVLWRQSPLTAREVVAALGDDTGWHPKTVRTLLGRLVKKKALTFEEDGHLYRYSPAVRREECVEREGRSFVERVFGGDRHSLLLHFARRADLSQEEADELRRILDGADEGSER
ncbi:MAG: BlaI/MecI/CopY family transcriptional regulator [Acidobacteriota bacterium]